MLPENAPLNSNRIPDGTDGSLIARKHGKRTIILRDDLRAFLAALPAVA